MLYDKDFDLVVINSEDYNKECEGSEDFIFVCGEGESSHWNPDIRETMFILPREDFYKQLINNIDNNGARQQLSIDFPRQEYKINNNRVSESSVLLDFLQSHKMDMSAIMCSTQAVMSHPFIWITSRLKSGTDRHDHSRHLTDKSDSKMSIEWSSSGSLDKSCQINKQLQIIDLDDREDFKQKYVIDLSLSCPFDNNNNVVCQIRSVNVD